jgi:guanylate kinase
MNPPSITGRDSGSPSGSRGVHPGGTLFIVSAPSGAGKTTLCRALRDRFPDLRYSVSFTTRAPRAGEVDGRDYHFISQAEFQEGIRSRRWAEWAEVHGNFYGTSMAFLTGELNAGNSILLDIDVEGMRQLLQRFPDSVTIFIAPPSMVELRRRLEARGTDSRSVIEGRLRAAADEMAHRDRYRYVIVNDRLETTVDGLAAIIQRHRGPVGR